MGEARRKRLYREELERQPLWYQIAEAFVYYARRSRAWWRKNADECDEW